METNQKPWKTMKPPWKTMETNQKPWKNHETTLKTMKNHENYLKKPWKPTSFGPKNVTSLTGGSNWPPLVQKTWRYSRGGSNWPFRWVDVCPELMVKMVRIPTRCWVEYQPVVGFPPMVGSPPMMGEFPTTDLSWPWWSGVIFAVIKSCLSAIKLENRPTWVKWPVQVLKSDSPYLCPQYSLYQSSTTQEGVLTFAWIYNNLRFLTDGHLLPFLKQCLVKSG